MTLGLLPYILRRTALILSLLLPATVRAETSPPALPNHPLPLVLPTPGAAPYPAVQRYLRHDYEGTLAIALGERAAAAQSQTLAVQSFAALAAGDIERGWLLSQRAVELRPGASDALFAAGLSSAARNDTARAIQFLSDATWFNRFSLVPPTTAWSLLSSCYAALDRHEDAAKALAKAGDQADTNSRHALALAQLKAGNFGAALPTLRALVQAEPSNQDFQLTFARALGVSSAPGLQRGQLEEAKTIIAALLANQSTPPAKRREAYELGIRVATKLEDPSSAADLWKKAVRQFPNDPQLLSLKQHIRIEQEAAALRAQPTPAGANTTPPEPS